MRRRPIPTLSILILGLAAQGHGLASDPGQAPEDKPVHTNRLAQETSPYLLQHQHNPVDWYPWGQEAFDKARRENKPIFLSVGYSTCHWCHVMERESFEDEEVARALNASFVAVKVDREERPDVDDLYMTAVQMMTGRGGWPMSVWLTPDLKPFFGGTYYPRERFLQVLAGLAQAWKERRDQVDAQAEQLAAALESRSNSRAAARTLSNEPLTQAVTQLASRFDEENGGFGGSPKFPNETNHLFLLGRYERTGEPRALDVVVRSLEKMAAGGIYDHLGGGFHRYSVDARWQVPHFEKMLYNQAWLGRCYLEAARLTGRQDFLRVVRETLEYVLRDMTSPEGAFYTAEDADSEGEEGVFYVWTPEEVLDVLGPEDGALFNEYYGVAPGGNFEHGRSVLQVDLPLERFAAARKLDPVELEKRRDRMRRTLLEVRARRERPLRDDKVLTGWNGMMIATFARAGLLLDDRDYVRAARRSAAFVLETNRDPDGHLLRVSRAGKAKIPAFQEDYAYLIDGLLELHRATGEARWLDESVRLADRMTALFYDDEGEGGFFATAAGDPNLLVRGKDSYDGAVPSGNSVAVDALIRLARLTGEPRFVERAEGTLGGFAESISRSPTSLTYMLGAADALRNGEAGPQMGDLAGILTARLEHEPGAAGAQVAAELRLTIREGWHINSSRPRQENLIPTELRAQPGAVALGEVAFPDGEDVDLPFSEEPMSVYEGEVRIPFRLAVSAGGGPRVARLSLRYQACDDRKCLAPAELPVSVPLHGAQGAGSEPVGGS